ncbi:hypothetical protein [uncultured Campylobacter sp.]|uniref:hypothetical protein n=1 Tax=uncultured Campylobacter sp. TaxID=218934 RepID=UPI00260FECE4|nr:hypothetical protein [uncultured Campylobacter sp.]
MNNFESLMEILNVLFLICFVWLIVCLIKFIRSKDEPERHKRDRKFLIISTIAFLCTLTPLVYFEWLPDLFISISVLIALPIISFIFLIVYLIKFIKSAKSAPERRRKIRNILILSTFLFIIFSVVLAGFLWLLDRALAHM